HVGQRHLGRRNQIEIPLAADLEEIRLELGQVAGAGQRRCVRQKGWLDFGVAMLPSVEIEHEVDEGSRETGTWTRKHRESRPSDLGPALEVDDPQRGTKVPMRLRRERELPRTSDATDFLVVRGAPSHRNTRIGKVGYRQQAPVPTLFDRFELDAQLLDLL